MVPFQPSFVAWMVFLAWNVVGVAIQCFGLYAIWHGIEILMRWYSRLYWADVLMRVAQSVTYATIEVTYRQGLIDECVQQNPTAGNCAQKYALASTIMIIVHVGLGFFMMFGGVVIQSYWSQLDVEAELKQDRRIGNDDLPAYELPPAYPHQMEPPPMYSEPVTVQPRSV